MNITILEILFLKLKQDSSLYLLHYDFWTVPPKIDVILQSFNVYAGKGDLSKGFSLESKKKMWVTTHFSEIINKHNSKNYKNK